jgi:predicted hotdog family 3-hydroxylacyl-ACP dehydratase
MLSREQIVALVPHQGAMCLLDRVLRWSAEDIVCGASSHLLPDNPLRRDGRLGAICGIEYGLQAAALHGALVAHGFPLPLGQRVRGRGRSTTHISTPPAFPLRQREGEAQTPGYLAALRDAALQVDRLDDPAFGTLRITATAELLDPGGSIYRFAVASESAVPLLQGRATIVFAAPPA